MQTCNPLTARWWFKLREPVNWFITIILFILIYYPLMLLLGGLVAWMITLGLTFCLFFFVLHKRPIGITCSNLVCGKHIETNTPWFCGNKGCRNDRVSDFPFVFKCEHCGDYPNSYKCHHCGKLVHLTKDPRKTGYAQSATDSIRIRRAKKRVKHGDIVSDTHDEIELRELDLKKAEVEAEISRVKTGAEAAKPQTIRERLRSKVQDKTELDDAVRELKREIDREFPDDPVERERRYAEVDAAARDFI